MSDVQKFLAKLPYGCRYHEKMAMAYSPAGWAFVNNSKRDGGESYVSIDASAYRVRKTMHYTTAPDFKRWLVRR